jgi:glycosyltransferase involved in cell wall biosynthesis
VTQPTVSVIMPSFNHGAVVEKTIASVLAQSFTDFEFLIEDDGSTDNSAEVLKRCGDPRIRLVLNPANQGAGVVTNNLISRSAGRYVALINSDDIWVKEKLARQVGWLDPNVDVAAVFSRASFIDERGAAIDPSKLSFGRIFEQVNRRPGQWLRRFLYEGNCLCNPSMMVRREALVRAGGFDNRLRQLPDLDMWARMAKRERFYIDEAALVNFRIWKREKNVRGDSPVNAARTMLEHLLIAESIFDGMTDDLMREGFHDLMRVPGMPTALHREIEQALLYFAQPQASYARSLRLIGHRKLYALLGRHDARGILDRDYGIDDRFFQEVGAMAPVFLDTVR